MFVSQVTFVRNDVVSGLLCKDTFAISRTGFPNPVQICIVESVFVYGIKGYYRCIPVVHFGGRPRRLVCEWEWVDSPGER